MSPHFGDIYTAHLNDYGNSVQSGFRPVLIVQNTIKGSTVEVLPITSKLKALHIPTHTIVKPSKENGLREESMVLSEQATTISTTNLLKKIGTMNRNDLINVGRARREQSHFPTD